ncbi:MAG: hypothetical protein ACT4PU_13800 [Planctomycetota bacterium]
MKHLRSRLLTLAALLCTAHLAVAGQTVEITVTGTVEYDVISAPPLGLVADGEPATLRFRVDSDSFVNSPSFPTRGYIIDKTSFSLSFNSATVALPSPYPAGQTAYFVIRNNDPGVDGFMLSAAVDGPAGVPLSQVGFFGNFTQSFYVTYGASLLPSLNILDAVGAYAFSGLTVFNWTVDDGPANPMGMIFEQISIAVVPQTFTDKGGALAGINGNPKLVGSGDLSSGSNNALTLTRAAPNALAALFIAVSSSPVPFKGGTLQANPFLGPLFLGTGPGGGIALPFVMPRGVPAGTELWLQGAIQDAAAVQGVSLSNALMGVTP